MKICPCMCRTRPTGCATREMATITSLTWNFRPQQPLGRWARLHLRHLQAHHPAYVQRLLLTGTLSEYLHTVDQQASERYDTLMKGYAKSWEITESLKSEDPMQWVGRMQLARSEAEHNVMTELICI